MSGGVACRCGDRTGWVVTCRNHNHSAFSGYRVTLSAYSEVCCLVCRGRWRTSAAYVTALPTYTGRFACSVAL